MTENQYKSMWEELKKIIEKEYEIWNVSINIIKSTILKEMARIEDKYLPYTCPICKGRIGVVDSKTGNCLSCRTNF